MTFKFLKRSVLSLFVLLAAASAHAIPVLQFNPSDSEGSVGDTIEVDLLVDLTASGYLGGYDISFTFDTSVVNLIDVVFGSGLDVPGGNPSFQDVYIDNANGFVGLSEYSEDDPFDLADFQEALFPLLTLTFDAVGAGLTGLNFDTTYLENELNIAYADVNALDGSICIDCGVEPVSEPMSAGFVALAFAGLLGWRKLAR